MFNDTEIGVVIGDGRSSIRLSRLADANELGYPTLIEVQAGPFHGDQRRHGWGLFCLFGAARIALQPTFRRGDVE
jgi:hypothetical protein